MEPIPFDEPRAPITYRTRVVARRLLPGPQDGNLNRKFIDVLDRRRSDRVILPPNIDEIGALLWHATRTRRRMTDSRGIIRESRSAPSAGGIHEIDTYLVGPNSHVVERYDSLCHALDRLVIADETCIDLFLNAVRAVSPSARGTVMAFIADTESIGGMYQNSASLFWRDAGCLLATMHLCAEALGLAFLPLGLLGENMIAGLGMPAARFSAVGAAVAGRRVIAGAALRR